MRPAEFTPEAIIQAGQELQTAGRNITGFALRQKVGGGNPSRLKQVWDEHINSQAVTKAEPVAELPVEVAEEVAAVTKALSERLAGLAVELNDKAVKAAERRVAEVIRTAGEQREQAERELADASQTVEDLDTKLDEAKESADGLEKRLTDTQAAHQAQAVELAQVRERLALTEQSVKTTTEEHAAELARLNVSIEAERNRYQQQVEQLREQLLVLKDELRYAHAEAADVRLERDRLAGTVEQARSDLAQKTEEMAQRERKLIEDAAAARAEATRVADQLKEQKTRSVDVIGRLEASKQRVDAELTEARREAKDAANKLARATGELEALRTQVAGQAEVIRCFAPAKG